MKYHSNEQSTLSEMQTVLNGSGKLATLKPICNTKPIGERPTMLLDYIMISFVQANAAEVGKYLFREMDADFVVMNSSLRGFGKVLTNDEVFIHYENIGKQKVVLLEIRGRGCRFLEKQEGHSWRGFFTQISKIGKVISVEKVGIKRIDIAVDSFKKDTLSPNRALNHLKKHLITSRFQSIRSIHEYRISNGDISGESVYLGRRTSNLSVLIYDKRLEKKSDFYWFRTEIRFRNDWGLKLLNALLDQAVPFPVFLSDVLKANLQFRSNVYKKSELRRRPFASWYDSYLNYIKKQQLHCLDGSGGERSNTE